MTIKSLVDYFKGLHIVQPRVQPAKRQTRYNYSDGPMGFLAGQIVREMQRIGHPAKIHCLYRSPEEQDAAFKRKASKARAWESPHQFYEAVDIIHERYAWFEGRPKQDAKVFFDDLNRVARMTADKYGVEFEYGYDWGWDPAHIEFKDWRNVKWNIGNYIPTADDLAARFIQLLPDVYLTHANAKGSNVPEWVPRELTRTATIRYTKNSLDRALGEYALFRSKRNDRRLDGVER